MKNQNKLNNQDIIAKHKIAQGNFYTPSIQPMKKAEYESCIRSHYLILDKIKTMYTKALYGENGFFSEEISECIGLCLKDIDENAYKISEYEKNYKPNQLESKYANFTTFEILAKIYEKCYEIEGAINICQQGISLGFPRDSSTGNLAGRKARLEVKLLKMEYKNKHGLI